MRVANAIILGAFVVLLIPALLIWNRSLIYVTGYGSDLALLAHALGTILFVAGYVKVGYWLKNYNWKEDQHAKPADEVSADGCACNFCHGMRDPD